MKLKLSLTVFLFAGLVSVSSNCSKGGGGGGGSNNPPVTTGAAIDYWITKGDKSMLLQKQTTALTFTSTATSSFAIDVDSSTRYQTIDGFGYTLTGGSAYVINHMSTAAKSSLLNELFGSGTDAIGVSYLRVSIGASDLNASVFSYDDMPAGQTDPTLANFSLGPDLTDFIPVLKEILAINPNIKILGSPWSPPVWMKDNGSTIGGGLQTQYYGVYANYFVKYIQAMAAQGIHIDAITIQNEPQYGGNNPSMVMSALQQAEFIKTNLGPAFQAAGLTTKIIVWDHNCDNPTYPITVMNDPAAKPFVDGAAFHLYAGDISALTAVKTAHPDKNLYFTEQWTGSNETFDGNLRWHVTNVIVGSMRNWSRVALEWNLASDPTYNPHTAGGCSECKGAVTISGSSVTRNESYYIVGHASKFVVPGSVRISSSTGSVLKSVAFVRPDGKKVLIIVNDSGNSATFTIKYKNLYAETALAAGAVGTYVW